MKKTIIAIGIAAFALAAFALAAYNKENVAPVAPRQEGIDASKVVFNFTVKNGEETKAVKTGWESGDKIFIFFNNVTTAYVTVTRGASDWDTPVLNGNATLNESGSLTAVYLPFGNSLTPSYSTSTSAWTFGETPQYTYYMAAKDVSYTISNTANVATLTATLTMQNPDGFVHFFVKDATATNGGVTLATDAVIQFRRESRPFLPQVQSRRLLTREPVTPCQVTSIPKVMKRVIHSAASWLIRIIRQQTVINTRMLQIMLI